MSEFKKNLKIVTVVHVVILLALCFPGIWCIKARRKKEIVIPLEFLVAVSSDPAPVIEASVIPKKQPPKPTPVPKKENRTPAPKKQPPKPRPKPSSQRSSTPPQKLLTPEEIEKLLLRGAKPSDRNVIPDDETINYTLIHGAFYDAWIQPSKAEAGNASVNVAIVLGGGGTVVSGRITKFSGVPALDASVQQVLGAVKRIDGLSAAFISANREVDITFRVE